MKKKTAQKKNVAKKNVAKKTTAKKATVQKVATTDKNYLFEAKESRVNNHALVICDDYENNFFNLYSTSAYLNQNSCTAFTHFNKSKNSCLICEVSDFCKHMKLNSDNSLSSVQFVEKVTRTACKKTMFHKMIELLIQDNSSSARKTYVDKLATEYNKKQSAVASKLSSYNCAINALLEAKENKIATDDKRTTRLYANMIVNNVKSNFVKKSATTDYLDIAYAHMKKINAI